MKKKINLLAPPLRTKRLLFARLIALEVGGLLFVCALAFGFLWQETAMLEQTVARLETEQKRLEPMRRLQQEIGRLRQDNNRKQQLYENWQGKNGFANETLTQLAVSLPPGVWLSELRQADKEKVLTLKGFALTMDDIARLVEQLGKLPAFEGAEVKDVSRDKMQSVQFEILLKRKGS